MGVVVSEMRSDTPMATLRTTANSRNSRPTMPPMRRIGMKTATREVLMERTRDGSAKLWEEGHDAIDGLNHVRAGLAKDGEEHGRFSAVESQVTSVLDGIEDFRNVAQAHRCADVSRDD